MKSYLFSLLLLFACLSSQGQSDTIFWFAAPEATASHGDQPIVLRINTSDQAANITVSQPANGGFPTQVLTLAPNTLQSIDLTPWKEVLECKPANTVLNYGLKVESDVPVTVYYENNSGLNPDIFVLKGQTALGLDFWIPSQNLANNPNGYSPPAFSSFDIVASSANTEVSITPASAIFGHPAGVPFTITLDAGQVYSATATSGLAALHLGGSRVTASKPVAITIKDDSMNTPAFGFCADLGGDQIVPTQVLGKEYIAVNGFLDNLGDQLFILATENNTAVLQNGNPAGNINAGQTLQLTVGNTATYIEASAPVAVLQLSGYGCELGLSILPQIECTGSEQVTITRSTNDAYFITLLVPDGGQTGFLFNGNAAVLPPGIFSPVPGTNSSWYFAKISLNTGLFPQGSVATVTNNLERFHLSVIHGGPSSGTRFGYFSNYGVQNSSDIEAAICEGESYEGYTETGTYVDYFPLADDCDSVRVLQLSVFPTYNLADTVRLCPGQSFPGVPGPGQYLLQLQSAEGCDSTVNLTLLQIDTEASVLPPDLLECGEDDFVLLDGSASTTMPSEPGASLSYQWLDPTGGLSGPADQLITQATLPGTYSLVVTQSLAGSICADTATVIVAYNPVVPGVPSLDGPVFSCPNEVHSYQVSPSASGTAPNQFLWSVQGGTLEAFSSSAEVTWGAGVTGTLCVIGVNNCGQSPPICLEVEVNPVSTATLSGGGAYCIGQPENLDFSVELSGVAPWQLSYLTPEGLQNVTVQSSPFVFSDDALGIYELLELSDADQCPGESNGTAQIQGIDFPQAFPVVEDVSCYGLNNGLIRIDSVFSLAPPLAFSLNGGPFSSTTEFANLAPGNYSLEVLDAIGCSAELELLIQEPGLLQATLSSSSTDLALGDSVLLLLQTIPEFGQLDQVQWSPAALVPCDTCARNWIRPLESIIISVLIEKDGCTEIAELALQVERLPAVYLPNIFSPNNDGFNDQFFVQTSGAVASLLRMEVYSRWGELVFAGRNLPPNDPAFGWDGTFRGKQQNSGVYLYLIEVEYIDGRVELFKGDVTLIR